MKNLKEYITEGFFDLDDLKKDLKEWWSDYVDSLAPEDETEYKKTLKNIADGKDELIRQAIRQLHTDYQWSHQNIDKYENDIIEIMKEKAKNTLSIRYHEHN